MPSHIEKTIPSAEYELLDSGEGEKLERYGSFVLSRPDPQALWKKQRPELWKKADGKFLRDGKATQWELSHTVPERWQIAFGDLHFWIHPSTFKHTGLFPEQQPNWDWIRDTIRKAKRPVSVLNLFGYTGGASLAAAQAGAQVCHVDGSKVAIRWGRENQEISGLAEKPIRWILDDARVFIEREIKRGKTYDAIIMDPPAFGHGPNKELWKIEDHFLDFLDLCKQVMTEKPVFFLINGYAAGYSALMYEQNLAALFAREKGSIESGELTIQETGGRLLPCGIFARWKSV